MNPLAAQLIVGAMCAVPLAVVVLALACVIVGRPLPRKENDG